MDKPEYRICVEPLPAEDGGGYVATVPGFSGCMSGGETECEAIQNAHDAVACWIDAAERIDVAVPEPMRWTAG
ncbi:type II toxin-antitoxin system HicB family antitoxin [Bradyrhizobium sp.]|uniref:type II toxin-antitoxin system HicB family antitoxin n=1 Tax=Bradyrhizobium sp. TaxID=376 RepID=UPI003C6A964B